MRQLKQLKVLAAGFALLLAPHVASADHDHDKHGDKMAEEHKHDKPAPTPAAAIEPRQAVKTEEVTYATLDGTAVKGYLARPEKATGPLPGLLVIHEWWGLNDNVKAMTRRLAGEGYQALALDLYEGKVAAKPEEAKALMDDSLTRIPRVMENIRRGYSYVGENLKAPKVGVIGWCYGGGWSLETAMNVPGLDAAVMYYGRVVLEEEELKPIEAPLLGLFGEADKSLPVESIKTFEATLKKLGKDAVIVIYPGADHAFANPSGGNYKADAAEDAWKRTTEHFARLLK
jgi:carboxymethylenebutenolidase